MGYQVPTKNELLKGHANESDDNPPTTGWRSRVKTQKSSAAETAEEMICAEPPPEQPLSHEPAGGYHYPSFQVTLRGKAGSRDPPRLSPR